MRVSTLYPYAIEARRGSIPFSHAILPATPTISPRKFRASAHSSGISRTHRNSRIALAIVPPEHQEARAAEFPGLPACTIAVYTTGSPFSVEQPFAPSRRLPRSDAPMYSSLCRTVLGTAAILLVG